MLQSQWLAASTRCDPWDLVVLGAGPAGAVAARQLALQGCRVLLIEKSPLPRFKVCGGCLGGAALELLEQIGLGDLPSRCQGVPLRTMQLANGGFVADIAIGRRVALSRQTFDNALVRHAMQAGTWVCDETAGSLQPSLDSHVRRIKLHRHGHEITIRARAVLMATGLSSSRRRGTTSAWSKSRIGLGILLSRTPSDSELGVLKMACSASGYVGIAPLRGDRLHIAAAVDSQALAAARSPGKLIDSIVKEAGLAPIDGIQSAKWRGTPLLTQQTRPLGGHRCLLIGDAAGYIEPFTGEGIGWAMQSALLASSLVEEGLREWHEGILQRWQHVYRDMLMNQQRRCHAIARLLRSKIVRQVAVWSLRHAPTLAGPLVRQLDKPFVSSRT